MDLLFHHGAIFATFGHQLRVRSRLADAAMFDDDDHVGARNGAQAMSDDKTRSSAHETAKTLLNESLTVGIEIAGGFVEDQHLGIGQDRAGDRQPLPLTAA